MVQLHRGSAARPCVDEATTRLAELGLARVGIERPDGPVVAALLAAGLPVAVVPPRQVKNLRSRYRRAGKDDRFDAYVLADAMRTDGHRFTALTRDTRRDAGLRALVRARQDLVEIRVGLVNQLRHTLELAFPGAVGLFFDLHSPIARAFLRRFPTAAEAAVLDEAAMAAWLAAEGYCGRTPAAVFIDRLRTAPAGLTGAEAAARRHVTLALLADIDAIEDQAAELQPPDQGSARPAPGRADLHQPAPRRPGPRRRAAGRDRRRPRPLSRSHDALAAAAGVCPFTDAVRQAPRRRLPLHRRHPAAPGTHRLRRRLPPRQPAGPPTSTPVPAPAACATRTPFASLARAWTAVIWRCWRDRATSTAATVRADASPAPRPA